VRYDQRDTLRSTSSPPGAPGHTGADLVGDAVAVLDGLGIVRAHVVGLSMGGGVAQYLAPDTATGLATLTLVSTTPVDPGVAGLPGPGPELRAAPSGRVVDRSRDIAASMTSHFLVDQDGPGDPRLGRLGGLPTLVAHGTADPLFPLAHGRALAGAVPGARLVELRDVGHRLPPPHTWERLVRHAGRPHRGGTGLRRRHPGAPSAGRPGTRGARGDRVPRHPSGGIGDQDVCVHRAVGDLYDRVVDVTISALRAGLSSWIDRVREGEEVVVTDRGTPVARLLPVDTAPLLDQLVRRGVIGRPARADRPVARGAARVRAGGPVADLVGEQRDRPVG
jgi:prevent-host-death family protein